MHRSQVGSIAPPLIYNAVILLLDLDERLCLLPRRAVAPQPKLLLIDRLLKRRPDQLKVRRVIVNVQDVTLAVLIHLCKSLQPLPKGFVLLSTEKVLDLCSFKNLTKLAHDAHLISSCYFLLMMP